MEAEACRQEDQERLGKFQRPRILCTNRLIAYVVAMGLVSATFVHVLEQVVVDPLGSETLLTAGLSIADHKHSAREAPHMDAKAHMAVDPLVGARMLTPCHEDRSALSLADRLRPSPVSSKTMSKRALEDGVALSAICSGPLC